MPRSISTLKDPPEPKAERRRTIGGAVMYGLDDIKPNFNLLVYGDPGVGKTTLAGSSCLVEEMSPVLYINLEGGEISLRQFKEQKADIDIIDVKDWNTLAKLLKELVDDEEEFGYKTVIVDNVSEMQYICEEEVMTQVLQKNPGRDRETPEWQDYGRRSKRMRKALRNFRDLNANVIYCAHATVSDTTRQLMPALSERLSRDFAGMLDAVFFLRARGTRKGVERTLTASPTSEYFAKTRYSKDRKSLLPEHPIPLLPMKDIWEILTERKQYNAET